MSCLLIFLSVHRITALTGSLDDLLQGMWMMLQQDNPEDFVLATGETHSVREFVEKAFKEVGVKIRYA